MTAGAGTNPDVGAAALTADRYGGLEVLRMGRTEVRPLGPRDLRVRVHAAGLNPADLHLLAGQPFFLRFMGNGLFRPKQRVPGSDVAGRIEAVGAEVTRFRPGDDVYANLSDVGRGALAEQVVAPDHVWARKPAGIDYASAAAVPMAGVTALQGLRDHGRIEPGMRVLVIGASGGVGGYAVQIAKAYRATVTGVASGDKLDLVRSFGADAVVDYRAEDVTTLGRRYDLVFDTVADRSVEAYRRLLEPDGAFVTTGFLPALAMPRFGRVRRDGPRMANMMSTPSAEDLAILAEWIEDGTVVPHVGRRFKLAEAVDAVRALSERRTGGKIVVTV